MITERISGLHSVLLPFLIQWYYIQLYTYVIIPLCWWPKRILCIHSETFLILRQICLPYFALAEVKKQAEMADNLQTRHGRRLVHSYFHLWTDKTRQMQRARELRDQTLLKRYANIWITLRERQRHEQSSLIVLSHLRFQKILRNLSAFLFCRSLVEWRKVVKKRLDERKTVKSFQGQLMNKKVRQSVLFYRLQTQLSTRVSSFEHLCSLLNFEHSNDACFNNRFHTV